MRKDGRREGVRGDGARTRKGRRRDGGRNKKERRINEYNDMHT